VKCSTGYLINSNINLNTFGLTHTVVGYGPAGYVVTSVKRQVWYSGACSRSDCVNKPANCRTAAQFSQTKTNSCREWRQRHDTAHDTSGSSRNMDRMRLGLIIGSNLYQPLGLSVTCTSSSTSLLADDRTITDLELYKTAWQLASRQSLKFCQLRTNAIRQSIAADVYQLQLLEMPGI
jgi:hypothetical protein